MNTVVQPKGWIESTLEKIVKIERTTVQPKEIQSGTIYLGLEHITSEGQFTEVKSVEAGELASSKFVFNNQHLLYGKLRPYLKKIARPDFSGVCITDILPILPSPKVDRNFLYYYLRQPSYIELATAKTTGANLPRLSPKTLAEFPIFIPPLEEQRRIAAILDKADAVLRKRQSAIALTEELLRSAFLEMFGDPVTNPKGWQIFELQTVTELIVDCPHSTPNWTDNGIICLRTSNLTEGGWNWDDTRYVTEEDYKNRTSRAKIFPGDIILSREGTVGIAAIVPDEFQVCMGQRLVQVRSDQRLIKPSYLLRLLLWQLAPERIGQLMRGSTSQHLNVKDLRTMSIPVACLELQAQFSKLARQTNALNEKMRKSEDEQEKNFNSLLQKAFRGQL